MRFPLLAAIVLAAASTTLSGQTTPQPAGGPPPAARLPSVTLPPELDRVLRDYERAWTAGDEAALAALFTDDGFVLQMGRDPVRGTAAIQQAYSDSGSPLHLRALGYAVDGNVGYIVGGFGSSPDRDGGKFILALRREPGGPWKIAADIDNPNARPSRAPSQ
ncbi:MAG TPA: nuclear transport factor 2 family protein [Longimicrobium sp.]|nr:nuclear transport factor 2 family protein [Longimicrobium sp.]